MLYRTVWKIKFLLISLDPHRAQETTFCFTPFNQLNGRTGELLFLKLEQFHQLTGMKKMLWSNLKLPFSKDGKRGKDVNSLVTKSNVNEEYKEAFRTNSYIEIYKKVQGQLERKNMDNGPSSSSYSSSSSSSTSSSSSSSRNVHLSEFLLEPHQETLAYMIENSELHQLLVNYFEISLEASRLCELLLRNVHKVSANYRVIKTAMTQMKKAPDGASWNTDDQCLAVYRNLVSFVNLRNPLSTITPLQFHELHENHLLLLHRLTSKCGKTKAKTKLRRWIKKVMTYIFVGALGALVIPLLILACHGMVGMVVAPVLFVLGSLTLFLKKLKVARKKLKKTPYERLGMQLDIAARGVYILIKDFDTISRLVQKLHDELEHEKFVAEICVRKGKNEILKEVLREFQIHGSSFLEQLEELEKQIYLCFLDINRSRRLLFEEIIN